MIKANVKSFLYFRLILRDEISEVITKKYMMETIRRTEIKDLFCDKAKELVGKAIKIKGWVRTKRGNKNVAFIALNDGSTIKNIQIVVDIALFSEDVLKNITNKKIINTVPEIIPSHNIFCKYSL